MDRAEAEQMSEEGPGIAHAADGCGWLEHMVARVSAAAGVGVWASLLLMVG